MPAQDRGRGHREDLRSPTAAHEPRQRRKPNPVAMIPPQPTGQLAAQHLVLVAQHQQLGILGQVRPDQHGQDAEQAPQQPVGERQQLLEMLSAMPLISQQNPSSRHETEFPSGTGSGRPHREQADADVRQVIPPAAPSDRFHPRHPHSAPDVPLSGHPEHGVGHAEPTTAHRWQPSTGRPPSPASTLQHQAAYRHQPRTRTAGREH